MKETLAIRAVKAFPDLFPDAWKHNEGGMRESTITVCTKCKLNMREFGVPHAYPTEDYDKPCTVPDPIVIDWNVAMKLVRECDYMDIWHPLADMKLKDGSSNGICIAEWITHKATPADYIEAACIAKEKSNEAM